MRQTVKDFSRSEAINVLKHAISPDFFNFTFYSMVSNMIFMISNQQSDPPTESKGVSLSILYFRILLIGYLLFIGYASFYLTDTFSISQTVDKGGDKLFFLFDRFRLHWFNLRDISTNILLYMPLGFLVAMYLACKDNLKWFGIHPWWGFILSFNVEIIQAFIGRFSDATDVMSNGTGYMLGFFVAYAGVTRFGLSPIAILGLDTGVRGDKLNTLIGLRFVYVTIAVFTALLPLDISVSVGQIYRKLQASGDDMPRLIVDLLFHFKGGVRNVQYLTLKLLPFLPLAFLSSVILFCRKLPSLLLPAFHCLLFGITIEFSNLFVQSGRSDAIVPILGFLSSFPVAYLVYYFGFQSSQIAGTTVSDDRWYLIASALLIYCLFIMSVALSPFEFELSLQAIRNKVDNAVNFYPFMLHFSHRSIGSGVDIAREFILYVPFGALLTLLLQNLTFAPLFKSSFKLVSVAAFFTGFFFASVVEILQLSVTGRCSDVTDVLLAALGSFGGSVIVPLFKGDEAAYPSLKE